MCPSAINPVQWLLEMINLVIDLVWNLYLVTTKSLPCEQKNQKAILSLKRRLENGWYSLVNYDMDSFGLVWHPISSLNCPGSGLTDLDISSSISEASTWEGGGKQTDLNCAFVWDEDILWLGMRWVRGPADASGLSAGWFLSRLWSKAEEDVQYLDKASGSWRRHA